MIEITLGQLVDLRPALGWVSGLDFSASDRFFLARKLYLIEIELRAYEVAHNKSIEKYVVRDDKTGVVRVPDDSPHLEYVKREIADLRANKVHLTITPIKASTIQKAAPADMPSAQLVGMLVALMPLLDWDIAEE